MFFFFSSRRRHTRSYGDWSSDVCSSDLVIFRASDLPRKRLSSARASTLPRKITVTCEMSVNVNVLRSARWNKIGRASCRERVLIAGVAGWTKRKESGGARLVGLTDVGYA